MAGFPNNPNQPRKPKKELTMEVRFIIAFVLMGIVLFVSPLVFGPPPGPPRPATPPPVAPAPNPEEPKKPEPQKPETTEQAAKPAREFIGPKEPPRTETVETKLYTVKLSNIGGVVTSWVLKLHKDSEGKPLELVNRAALTIAKKPAPFSIMNQDGKEAELNNAVFSTSRSEDSDSITVSFHNTSGAIRCTKTFRFRKNSYLSTVTSEVKQNDTYLPHLLEWRGGFCDFKVLNRPAGEQSGYFDLKHKKMILHS